MILSAFTISLIALSAISAGFINALAGGGTLITFPALTMLGVPAVVANVTNTVALCPGYLSATMAQRDMLADQKRRLLILVPTSVAGGVAGGVLLLRTGESTFRAIIPFLILFASILLAAQTPVRKFLTRFNHSKSQRGETAETAEQSKEGMGIAAIGGIFAATIYGGYFGAGVSVIILAALGITLNDSLVKLNAVKQAISFSCNVAAAVFFVFSGRVDWTIAAIMAGGALLGGMLGGKLANRVSPGALKIFVVSFGIAISLYYFFFARR